MNPMPGATREPRFLVLGSHRRRRLARWARNAALGLAGLYVAACLGVLLFERQLTYRPDPRRIAPAAVRLDSVVEQHLATPDGARLVVWRLAARAGNPTLLYFPGNGQTLAWRSGRIAAFAAEGWGLSMLGYRGFSGSTGRPSEPAIVADALLAYDALQADGISPRDIVIYGESLGTSVAVRTALARPAAGLVIEAPFTSMPDTWRQFAPMLPVGLLLRDRWDTISRIGGLRMPLLVMHGEKDRVVGHHMGRRVFAAAPGPKRFETFPEAGHINLYGWNAIAAVRRFVDDLRAGRLR